ncbi:MAG: hypothetical protein H3Z52_06150 [archaeon]|nr:hypothetical protein [archaeon]
MPYRIMLENYGLNQFTIRLEDWIGSYKALKPTALALIIRINMGSLS